jgi:hypothetical protein
MFQSLNVISEVDKAIWKIPKIITLVPVNTFLKYHFRRKNNRKYKK